MISGVVKRLRETVIVVVVAAMAIRFAADLLTSVWPLLVVLACTLVVLSIAIQKR